MRPPKTAPWLIFILILATAQATEWTCPGFNETRISCSCDYPHTLRCTVPSSSLELVAKKLRLLPPENPISLLDCTVENVTFLPDFFLAGVRLHGLVITSGELKGVSNNAFRGLLGPLQALGLPNNRIEEVPNQALRVLRGLERLDLSHNRVSGLNSSSFYNLDSLTFLDVSENQISEVTKDAFSSLKRLKMLNLRKNRIDADSVSALFGLDSVEDVDLSTNALSGPLQSDTLPHLPCIRTLNLANNQFSSIRGGALSGASSLITLSLNHNHIDVLEDHAFRELSSLRSLDLSNNRIVAISGSSLAHLTRLSELDLSHNFLRALTSDIISPLTSLQVLHLDDNDISMVAADGFSEGTTLRRLTLSDNPLNCDCSMIEFSAWFSNASHLSADDRSTAVCMTPPHLENALLIEVPPSDLVCEENDEFPDNSVSAHVSGAQIVLRAFNFDGTVITLFWSIDPHIQTFTCDALFVYEEMSTREVLLNSTPLRCNSSQLADPTTLVVRLPRGGMQSYHRYRYCIVLLEDIKLSDEMQLVLGCSDIIPLISREKSVPQSFVPGYARIAAVEANVSFNVLTVSVQLRHDRKLGDVKCHVTVIVFMMESLLTQHTLNCTNPRISITGLPKGQYHVCATLGTNPATETKPLCVIVKAEKLRGTSGSLLIVCFVVLMAFAILGIYLWGRRMVKWSRLRSTTHQCFLATGNDTEEEDQKQHSRYVKLKTTPSATTTTTII